MTISRIATYGGEARTLFRATTGPGQRLQPVYAAPLTLSPTIVMSTGSTAAACCGSSTSQPVRPAAGLVCELRRPAPSPSWAVGSGKVFVLGNGVVFGSNQVLIATIDQSYRGQDHSCRAGQRHPAEVRRAVSLLDQQRPRQGAAPPEAGQNDRDDDRHGCGHLQLRRLPRYRLRTLRYLLRRDPPVHLRQGQPAALL